MLASCLASKISYPWIVQLFEADPVRALLIAQLFTNCTTKQHPWGERICPTWAQPASEKLPLIRLNHRQTDRKRRGPWWSLGGMLLL